MSDHPDKPVETPKAWIRFAEGDLAVAQREMQSEMPVYHTICFLCQSAAEKFLKGYLISVGWKLQKTHDIVELLGRCAGYDEKLGAMIAEGAVLNEYIVAGRYPGDVFASGIDSELAEEALSAVQQIRSRVRELMPRETLRPKTNRMHMANSIHWLAQMNADKKNIKSF